jgi:hypothetical protein
VCDGRQRILPVYGGNESGLTCDLVEAEPRGEGRVREGTGYYAIQANFSAVFVLFRFGVDTWLVSFSSEEFGHQHHAPLWAATAGSRLTVASANNRRPAEKVACLPRSGEPRSEVAFTHATEPELCKVRLVRVTTRQRSLLGIVVVLVLAFSLREKKHHARH